MQRPWPAMLRTISGDHERYGRRTGADSRIYFAGDGARIDADGYFWMMGRIDDVINVAGHRISTMEVESALVDHHAVAEAAVVGRPDDLKGQAIVAFVTLKGVGGLARDARGVARARRGDRRDREPENILFTPELPKTRSGKIMRRLFRDVAEHRPLGDTTTLADPGSSTEIARRGPRQTSPPRTDASARLAAFACGRRATRAGSATRPARTSEAVPTPAPYVITATANTPPCQ